MHKAFVSYGNVIFASAALALRVAVLATCKAFTVELETSRLFACARPAHVLPNRLACVVEQAQTTRQEDGRG